MTDYAPPSDAALARIPDIRVAQFWDRRRLTSENALPVLRNDAAPVIGSQSLVTGRVVWDFVAIYPKGARWGSAFPAPVFKGAPVVDVMTEFKSKLRDTLEAASSRAAYYPGRKTSVISGSAMSVRVMLSDRGAS